MVTYNYPPTAIDTTGLATEAKQDVIIVELQTANAELILQTAELAAINTELNTQTVELLAINAELDTQTTALNDINTELNTQTVELAAINTELNTQTALLTTIDASTSRLAVFQTSALIDASSTNIPGNASLPLQLIASTSAATYKIQIVEDIGEYMALYTGAASSEVLLCAMPLGGGDVEVSVPIATRISIKALQAPAITSANLIINLLG